MLFGSCAAAAVVELSSYSFPLLKKVRKYILAVAMSLFFLLGSFICIFTISASNVMMLRRTCCGVMLKVLWCFFLVILLCWRCCSYVIYAGTVSMLLCRRCFCQHVAGTTYCAGGVLALVVLC
jgi:hypothetical protein